MSEDGKIRKAHQDALTILRNHHIDEYRFIVNKLLEHQKLLEQANRGTKI